MQPRIGHFGNNLLPLVPELAEFFEDPVVKGALVSVLGNDYSMHPHRALHMNPPESPEQGFHKDSYWGYVRRVRNHRPWWVMIMYFPQDTPLEKGPTAVMSGSQFLNQRPEKLCEPVSASGPAGTFILIHYDIWHRKMLNQTDLNRYMFKFEFTRLRPPVRTNHPANWRRPKMNATPELTPAWRSIWSWLNGSEAVNGKSNGYSIADLGSEDEATGISAGYSIGSGGPDSLSSLLDALDCNADPYSEGRRYSDDGSIWRNDSTVRNAAHGLVHMGTPALKGLRDVVRNGTDRGRKHAAFALGEIGSQSSIPALTDALDDSDVHVRIAATEALGILSPTPRNIEGLVHALQDEASEVRFDAALSLLRASTQASKQRMASTIPALENALYDTNRYVCGHAAETLERIGSPQALEALLPFLRSARWCAHTDNQRPF